MASGLEKFREMGPAELAVQEAELTEELFRLRFQIAAGQMEGLKRYRQGRRDLARVKTLRSQLARAAEKGTHGS
jgi:large subunit ribosomal protein L29